LEKIRRTKGPGLATVPLDNKNMFVCKSSNICCHYCKKKNHKALIVNKFLSYNSRKKSFFEDKAGTGKKSLASLLEDINELKRQLKTENTAYSKKMKAESLLFSLY
jgi:hypothetical protein